jgi:hypothetical protein
MTAAEQPSLDLGDYRGKNILRTSVRLQNTNDGFHPSTDLDEPRIFELDEELTVAIRIRVSAHHPKVIEKGEDAELGMVELLQDFKCGTIAIIPDTGATKKALDSVESRRKAADEAAAKAKAAAKKAAAPKRTAKGKGGEVVPISSSLQEASDKGGFQV